MTIKTFIGNLELLKSEIIHVSGTNKLKIEVDNLILIFEFEKNDSKQPEIKKELINEQTLKVSCTNFKNPLGEGVLSPIELGTLGGKKLFLSFFVWTPNIDKDAKIFNYCLYLG